MSPCRVAWRSSEETVVFAATTYTKRCGGQKFVRLNLAQLLLYENLSRSKNCQITVHVCSFTAIMDSQQSQEEFSSNTFCLWNELVMIKLELQVHVPAVVVVVVVNGSSSKQHG